MSRTLDLMRRMSKNRFVRSMMARIQTPLDMRFKDKGFAISRLGGPDLPLCYLTTTGRRSGEPRTVPLISVRMDSAHAVVASNYGRSNHPAWSHNLDANPGAILEINGTSTSVVARRATDDEAPAIWDRFDGIWPGYEEYRAIAPRDIRVYVLNPVDPERGST